MRLQTPTFMAASLVLAAASSGQSLIDLSNSWNGSVQDNLTMLNGAYPSGYGGYRIEARVYSPTSPPLFDVAPLHRWYSPSRGDYFTTSEPVWRGAAGQTRSPDYQWIGVEGHALANPYAGTCPMYGWFSPSRGDNWLSTQYELNGTGLASYGTDYGRGYLSGYAIRDHFAAKQELREPFHFGRMYFGGAATGSKPLQTVLFRYTDISGGPLTLDQVTQRVAGPTSPNLTDYFAAMSGGVFRWRGGADRFILDLAPLDDPDTVVSENTWFPGEDMSDNRALYVSLRSSGGQYLAAENTGGGPVIATATSADDWERFSLVVLNIRDGWLLHGDTVALKSSGGKFLRTDSTSLIADGTGGPISATAFPQNQRFTVEKLPGSPGTVIRTGDAIRIKSQLTSRYIRAVGGGGGAVTVDASSPGVGTDFTFGKAGRSGAMLERQIMAALEASPGFDFASFDANHDGVVTTPEFHLLVVEKRNNPTLGAATWGQTRNPAGRFRPRGASVDVDLYHAYAGEDTAVTLWAHEVAHTMGAGDLYGHDAIRNAPLSLMGPPLSTPMMLDPWHRLRLGWATPRVFNMTDPGQVLTLTPPDSTADYNRQPVVLYDPARYNLNTRQGEYFILEFRNGRRAGSGYDRGVADPGNQSPVGMALWQVKTDSSGNLFSVAAEGGAAGSDKTCNHLAAPTGSFAPYTRGNWELWTAAHGTVRPKYLDGTFAPVRIRIAGGTSAATESIDVEWSNDGVLWPRLDSARNAFNSTTNVRAGAVLRVKGVFPVSPSETAVTVDVFGPVTSPIVSYGPYQIDARIPLSSPRGLAIVEIGNGAKRSNRHVINVLCAADFNESGGLPTVQDLFDFLAAYFANDPRADFNGSGVVTVQDNFDFLAAYFAGCV